MQNILASSDLDLNQATKDLIRKIIDSLPLSRSASPFESPIPSVACTPRDYGARESSKPEIPILNLPGVSVATSGVGCGGLGGA